MGPTTTKTTKTTKPNARSISRPGREMSQQDAKPRADAEPARLVVRFAPGLQGEHTIHGHGSIRAGLWYVIDNPELLERVRETRIHFEAGQQHDESASAFDARNPRKFEVLTVADAIKLELAGQLEGSKPSKKPGSPSNPLRPAPFR